MATPPSQRSLMTLAEKRFCPINAFDKTAHTHSQTFAGYSVLFLGKEDLPKDQVFLETFNETPQSIIHYLFRIKAYEIVVLNDKDFATLIDSSCDLSIKHPHFIVSSKKIFLKESAFIFLSDFQKKTKTWEWIELTFLSTLSIPDPDKYLGALGSFLSQGELASVQSSYVAWIKYLKRHPQLSEAELLESYAAFLGQTEKSQFIAQDAGQLSRTLLPSRASSQGDFLQRIAQKGIHFKLRDIRLSFNYVGVDRSHDSLHSARLDLSSIAFDQFLSSTVHKTMQKMLPESFFLYGPDWNLNLSYGLYVDYKGGLSNKLTNDSRELGTIDFGAVLSTQLDFDFDLFQASLQLLSKWPVIRDAHAQENLRPDDAQLELALLYHFMDGQINLGARIYLGDFSSGREFLNNNLIFTLEGTW